ncbi:unnamed protein product, partial [Staurois parvus]
MRRRMQPFSARLIVTETVTCAESLCIPSLHISFSQAQSSTAASDVS